MYVHVCVKEREEGRYPATKPAFWSLIRQHGLIYLTLDPIKMIDAVRTSIKFRAKKTCTERRNVTILYLAVICHHISFPDNLV